MDQTWVNPDRNNLILQARFGREYGQRLSRFYRRANLLIRFLQMMGGTAAFATLISTENHAPGAIAMVSSLLVAVAASLDMLWSPGELGSQCARAAEAWGQLDADSGSLDDVALQRRTASLQSTVLPSWEALRTPVFNEILRQHGEGHQAQSENRWQRFVFWLC